MVQRQKKRKWQTGEMLRGDGEMEALRILSWQLSLMIEERRKEKNTSRNSCLLLQRSTLSFTRWRFFFFYFLTLLPLFQHLLLNPISTFFIILSFTVCGENASEVEIGILALCSEPRLLRLPNGFSFNATSGSYNSDKLSNTVILISMVYQIN